MSEVRPVRRAMLAAVRQVRGLADFAPALAERWA